MSGIIGGAGSKSGVIGTTELDYEEGTWTPASSVMTNWVVSNNTYTKIGREVTVRAYITSGSASGGLAYITGLPYTSGNASTGSALTYYVDWSAGTGLAINIAASATQFEVVTYGDNITWANALTLSNNDLLKINFTYNV